MKPYLFIPLAASLVLSAGASAQEPIDTTALRQIRDEGFNHSMVLETAVGLSDLSPPRLAGSPGYLSAARWARDRLSAWGMSGARLEPWGRATPAWVLDRYLVEMTSPWYLHLTAFPRAWSPATPRPVSGPVRVVRIEADSDFARVRGTLRGRIVLNGPLQPVRPLDGVAHRFSDAELDSLARLTSSGSPRNADEDIAPWVEKLQSQRRVLAFLHEEGALALVEPSPVWGALEADGWWAYPAEPLAGVPSFTIAPQQYNRLLRLSEAGRDVRVTASLQAHLERPDSLGYNVVAEIPGSDPRLRDQVVLLGGHLDSWIAGSGAADNAAGVAVIMEALRILRARGLTPRRTIRVALWDGEETSEEYAGSAGYVRRHFGRNTAGKEQLAAYLNVDNGSGRVRGIYLNGQAAVRSVFEEILAPLADLGAGTVTLGATGGTDHIAFLAAGLPGFQFIQDPLDYETTVHHTSLDTADHLVEDDLKQAAVVVAAVAFHLGNRDEMLPRTQ